MDKRANNSTRRFLKHVLGVMAPASLTISVVGFWLQAPAIVMVGSLSVTALCVTIAGILASGESVTTSDMVQILRELTRGLKMKPSPGESASRSGSRKKGKEER